MISWGGGGKWRFFFNFRGWFINYSFFLFALCGFLLVTSWGKNPGELYGCYSAPGEVYATETKFK